MSTIRMIFMLALSLVLVCSMGSAFAVTPSTKEASINLYLTTSVIDSTDQDTSKCTFSTGSIGSNFSWGNAVDLNKGGSHKVINSDWNFTSVYSANNMSGLAIKVSCPDAPAIPKANLLDNIGFTSGRDKTLSASDAIVTVTVKRAPGTNVLPNSDGLLIRDDSVSTAKGLGIGVVGGAYIDPDVKKSQLWNFAADGGVVFQGHISEFGKRDQGSSKTRNRTFPLGLVIGCGPLSNCKDDGHISGGKLKASFILSLVFS